LSFVVIEGVKMNLANSFLSRARACGEGRGLELGRKLQAERKGSTPQVIAAEATK
jgi:hypothetical protein